MGENAECGGRFADCPELQREREAEVAGRRETDPTEVELVIATGTQRQHFAVAGDFTMRELMAELRELGLVDPNKNEAAVQLVNGRTSERYRLSTPGTIAELQLQNGDQLQVVYDASVAAAL